MSDYVLVNGELYHHGTKGQRWGVRRYQNEDGSLTPEGYQRYRKASDKLLRIQSKADKMYIKSEHAIGKLKKKSRRWYTSDDALVRTAQKYRRAHKKYARSLKKANRFYEKMEKQYARELNPAQVESGKRFMQMYVNDSSKKLHIVVGA